MEASDGMDPHVPQEAEPAAIEEEAPAIPVPVQETTSMALQEAANPERMDYMDELQRKCRHLYELLETAINPPREWRQRTEQRLGQLRSEYLETWHSVYDPCVFRKFDVDAMTTWNSLSQSLQQHKPFVMRMLQGDVQVLPESLRNFIQRIPDRDTWLALLARGDFSKYWTSVPSGLHDDGEVMIALATKFPRTLGRSSDRLLASPQFVYEALLTIFAHVTEFDAWKAISQSRRLKNTVAVMALDMYPPCKEVVIALRYFFVRMFADPVAFCDLLSEADHFQRYHEFFRRYINDFVFDVPMQCRDNHDIMIALADIDSLYLRFASDRLKATQEFFRDAVLKNENEIWNVLLGTEHLTQPGVVVRALKEHPPCKKVVQVHEYHFAHLFSNPDDFRDILSRPDDFQTCNTVLRKHIPGFIFCCPDEIGDSHDMMVALAGMDSRYLRFASDRLTATQEFVEEAVEPAFLENADGAWEGLSHYQMGQKVYAITALRSTFRASPFDDFDVYLNLHSPELARDKDIALAVVDLPSFTTVMMKRADLFDPFPFDDTLRDDPEVMIAVASRISYLIAHASDELLSRPEFVEEAISAVGYAILRSPTARETLRSHQGLFIQLIQKSFDTLYEHCGLLDAHFDEMTSVEWSRGLALAWLTHGSGYFPGSSHEHFLIMRESLYRDDDFMNEAITKTLRLEQLLNASHPVSPWDFEKVLTAVLSHRDSPFTIDSALGVNGPFLRDFAEEARYKLELHERFVSFLLAANRSGLLQVGSATLPHEMNKVIADFMGVPYGEALRNRIRMALAFVNRMGYGRVQRDAAAV